MAMLATAAGTISWGGKEEEKKRGGVCSNFASLFAAKGLDSLHI